MSGARDDMPRFWIDRAEEARAKAEETRYAETRDVLIRLAAHYERFALISARHG